MNSQEAEKWLKDNDPLSVDEVIKLCCHIVTSPSPNHSIFILAGRLGISYQLNSLDDMIEFNKIIELFINKDQSLQEKYLYLFDFNNNWYNIEILLIFNRMLTSLITTWDASIEYTVGNLETLMDQKPTQVLLELLINKKITEDLID